MKPSTKNELGKLHEAKGKANETPAPSLPLPRPVSEPRLGFSQVELELIQSTIHLHCKPAERRTPASRTFKYPFSGALRSSDAPPYGARAPFPAPLSSPCRTEWQP
jgi:hypothetical protein